MNFLFDCPRRFFGNRVFLCYGNKKTVITITITISANWGSDNKCTERSCFAARHLMHVFWAFPHIRQRLSERCFIIGSQAFEGGDWERAFHLNSSFLLSESKFRSLDFAINRWQHVIVRVFVIYYQKCAVHLNTAKPKPYSQCVTAALGWV